MKFHKKELKDNWQIMIKIIFFLTKTSYLLLKLLTEPCFFINSVHANFQS